MTDAEQKAFAQGRAAGLEEAAQACQQRAMNHASEVREDEADACADAIRALSPTPSDAGKDDALELDAKRYRWLRDHPQKHNNGGGQIHFTFAVARPEPNEWCIDTKRGADMDAAIDAAIAAQGEGK